MNLLQTFVEDIRVFFLSDPKPIPLLTPFYPPPSKKGGGLKGVLSCFGCKAKLRLGTTKKTTFGCSTTEFLLCNHLVIP